MNTGALLSGFVQDVATAQLQGFLASPKVLRTAAQMSGIAAGRAEYAARSLRRMEARLNARADDLVRAPARPPTQGLATLIRECWKE